MLPSWTDPGWRRLSCVEFQAELALADGQLEMHYQPKLRLPDCEPYGAEALMRVAWRLLPAALLLGGVAMLAACQGGAYFSPDPRTAATQQWALGCKMADANICTATVLLRAEQLSESAAETMDDVVVLYELICAGDPPAGDGDLVSGAAKLIAARLCPSWVPPETDDWALTIAAAASCAAEAALLAEAT